MNKIKKTSLYFLIDLLLLSACSNNSLTAHNSSQTSLTPSSKDGSTSSVITTPSEDSTITDTTISTSTDPINPVIEPPTGEYYEDEYCYYSVEQRSDIYYAIEKSWGAGCSYPSILEIQHAKDEKNNGTLLCAYSIPNSGLGFGPSWIELARSLDHGITWGDCTKIFETIDPTIEACWNAHLFELPAKMGSFDAGTIILAGVSIDARQERKSQIALWASTDLGKTFKEISVAVSSDYVDGVWEPHLVYEGGYLYCFFADSRGDGINNEEQTIAYVRTKDCLTWEDTVGVVYGAYKESCPGMPVLTKMGNDKYFLVYEYRLRNGGGVPIYFKTSKFIDKWGKYDDGQQLFANDGSEGGSSPFCLWVPGGSNCGTLFVTTKYGSNKDNKIFVSHDYGKTFDMIPNFLPYSNGGDYGYHASFFCSTDNNTLYYANNVDNTNNKGKIAFCRIKIINKN